MAQRTPDNRRPNLKVVGPQQSGAPELEWRPDEQVQAAIDRIGDPNLRRVIDDILPQNKAALDYLNER